MPSRKRPIKIVLSVLLLLFLIGSIWFFRTSASLHPTVLDDGSVLSIVDVATAPNQGFYVGVQWKRGFALMLKNSNSKLKRNFGHLSVTNQSAISWQRKYFTNATTTNVLNGFHRDPIDIIRIVDANGVEHEPQPFFSFSDKQPNGETIDCAVFLFNTSLQPPAFLRILGRDATNEIRFSK